MASRIIAAFRDGRQDNRHAALARMDRVVAEAKRERRRIAHGIIRHCRHERLYSMNRNAHPYGDDEVACTACGLCLPRGAGMWLSTPLISLKDAVVVTDPAEKPVVRYAMNIVQRDAIERPYRFTRRYLEKLFEGSPWSAEEVTACLPDSHVWQGEARFDSYGEWVEATRR